MGAQIRYTHLIWDFDGTLYDTYPLMTQALLAALAERGQTAPYGETYALIKQKLYPALVALAARFGLSTDELAAAYRAQRAKQTGAPPMPGLFACLRDTARLGCRHYLFTHSDRRAVEQIARDGLAQYFTDYVTRDQGFAEKPSPDAILYLMQKHRFTADNALMIGDRDIDIASGSAAGVRGVLLDPGRYYPALPVTYRIQALSEIVALVR